MVSLCVFQAQCGEAGLRLLRSTSVGAQIDTKGFLSSLKLVGLNIKEAGEGGCCLFFAHKFLPNDSFLPLETTSHSLA